MSTRYTMYVLLANIMVILVLGAMHLQSVFYCFELQNGVLHYALPGLGSESKVVLLTQALDSLWASCVKSCASKGFSQDIDLPDIDLPRFTLLPNHGENC